MPPRWFQSESEQHLPWRVSLTVVGVSLLSLAVILILGWWAMATVDRNALDRERAFAIRGLEESFSRIPIEQESAVVWSEAVEKVRAGDQAWISDNLGEWMGSYFGHNDVFILTPENTPIYAMKSGTTVGPEHAYGDVREAIEPVAARQAALQRLPEDLADIDRLLVRQDELVEDIQAFSQLNVEWHLAIVRASHNPLFLTFMTSISSALYSATNREEFNLETRRIVMKAHRKISEAIKAGDADAALRRMKRHVTSYAEELDLGRPTPHLGTAE